MNLFFPCFQIQTLGGALFQANTVCAAVSYDPSQMPEGGGAIEYSARKVDPTGAYSNATGIVAIMKRLATLLTFNIYHAGILTPLDNPGHFEQRLVFNGVEGFAVDFNVIW